MIACPLKQRSAKVTSFGQFFVLISGDIFVAELFAHEITALAIGFTLEEVHTWFLML